MTEQEKDLISVLKSTGMNLETTVAVVQVLHESQMAIKEMIVWVYDNKPTKEELLGKLSELGNAIQRGDYPTQSA